MSGAHYVASLPRSRSPSPVPQRRRAASSINDDSSKDPKFGDDNKPRRASFRHSGDESTLLVRESRLTNSCRLPRGSVMEGSRGGNFSQQGRIYPSVGQDPDGSSANSQSGDFGIPTPPSSQGDKAEEVDKNIDDIQYLKVETNKPRSRASSQKISHATSRTPLPENAPADISSSSRARAAKQTELRAPSEFTAVINEPTDDSDENSYRRKSYGSINDQSTEGSTRVPIFTQTASLEFSVNQNPEMSRLLSDESTDTPSYYTPSMVDNLRKRNCLYFLDPITKLMHLHGFPWKLTLQIVKVVLITTQIIIFGGQRQTIQEFFERSNLAFKHLLLQGWDIGFETMPYPPATGQYAIYKLNDLYHHMNFAMEQYHHLPHMSISAVELNRDPHGMPWPVELCSTANDVEIYPNGSYTVRDKVIHNCTAVYPDSGSHGNYTYDIYKFIQENDLDIAFNRTLHASLTMYVKIFHLNLLETHYGPTCYNDSLKIVYTNNERSGQVLISLESLPSEIDCEKQILTDEIRDETKEVRIRTISMDAVVIVVCALSSLLCGRSLKRSNKLRKDTALFFKRQRNEPLSCNDQLEYINMWYVVIIINDILTITGSCFKIQLESRVFSISSANYELCSMLLGLGVLLTYVGILRYFGFFKSYNVLILTLKTSFPHVLRFLVCAICLYTGFLFCGWVIFSPYNIKFRKLSSASECLFSLVNGDDMFVSFSALTTNSNAIWYFNRAYLYVFISLFIYVVISVFIAVILDNYENLKHYYEGTRADTVIQAFMKEGGEMPLNEVFSHVRRHDSCQAWFFCLFPCLACLRSRFTSTSGCNRCSSMTSDPRQENVEYRVGQRGTSTDDLMQDIF